MQDQGIFMGTAEDRALVEQQFGIQFSPDARLWQTNQFSPLVGGSRFHKVIDCQSENPAFNKNLTETIVAVIDYGASSYTEFFRPSAEFAASDPTGGNAPSQMWIVRGYVDDATRVVQNLKPDGTTVLCLSHIRDVKTGGEHGAEATIDYTRGTFKFAVTVAPVVP